MSTTLNLHVRNLYHRITVWLGQCAHKKYAIVPYITVHVHVQYCQQEHIIQLCTSVGRYNDGSFDTEWNDTYIIYFQSSVAL